MIVAGVLLALAADRWNQTRIDARTKHEYVVRLIAEIENDSVETADAIASSQRSRAARDTLLWVADGTLPRSAVNRGTFIAAGYRFVPPPVMAWNELISTGMLTLLDDATERQPLAVYYATRNRVESALALVEGRSRDPYFDALYPIGIMEQQTDDAAAARFFARPDAEELLRGLGGLYSGYAGFLENLRDAAGVALPALRAAAEGR